LKAQLVRQVRLAHRVQQVRLAQRVQQVLEDRKVRPAPRGPPGHPGPPRGAEECATTKDSSACTTACPVPFGIRRLRLTKPPATPRARPRATSSRLLTARQARSSSCWRTAGRVNATLNLAVACRPTSDSSRTGVTAR